jgi:hypothetical protein
MKKIWQSVASLTLVAAVFSAASSQAQEAWNPFREKDEAARRTRRPAEQTQPTLSPMDGVFHNNRGPQAPVPPAGQPGFGSAYPGSDAPPAYARTPPPQPGTAREASNASKIERLELEPALTTDGSGLPLDAWRGLDVKAVEESFASLSMPPKSAALHALWQRLLSASADAPTGGQTQAHFDAVRLEALYRSGLIGAMSTRLEATSPTDPIFQSFAVRRDLALGKREAACQTIKGLMGRRADLPKQVSGDLHLLAGYCAAVAGNAGGAGVAADLAREENVDAPVALAALDALAGHGKGPLTPPKQVRVLDYRLLELLGPVEPEQVIDRAEPALVAALALQETAEPRLRIAAAEAAARLWAISAEQLTATYRAATEGADDPALRRAELIRLIAAETAPPRKLQLMRTALDEAKQKGLYLPIARVLAPMLAQVAPSPDLRATVDTAIEIALAAGDTRRARDFATSVGARHWLALIDIGEAGLSEESRERNLEALDDMVKRGRFSADLLHRLATVLDATDVNVPIPLWEAASRTPQPSMGYLPDTGVLAQLQDAAKKKDQARTILLSLRAFGPVGADGVHLIALGDTIRALRRAGLDRDARALGVEALLAQWPRSGGS